MQLDNTQIDILRDGRIEENRFYIQTQLDRKQYVSINDVLNTIGLVWNRGKKAHIAEGLSEEDLKNAIGDIVETGEVETLKETIKKFQFYPTPKEVAEFLVELADVQDEDHILEPSAGKGAIADYLPMFNKITLVELNKENYEFLKSSSNYQKTDDIVNEDFLEYKSTGFDKIIMNPPFSNSQDAKHILKAYDLLKIGGRIVSIASSSIQHREGKVYDAIRDLSPEYIELPEGSFKESGTLVNTVILVINK